MLSRRHFLQGSLTTLLLGSVASGWAQGRQATRTHLLSAADDTTGAHHLLGVNERGERTFMAAVPERCHGGCARPQSHEVVIFARRPGSRFHVLDAAESKILRTVDAEPGQHFYGHGVFDRDGRYLYVTANRYASAEGIICVYDALENYALFGEIELDGIGPHELRLHPDGETLVVALGGIRTHPDYGRVKLNLDSMTPALLLVDRHSGHTRQRFEPSHHQLSCRHLDISPEGVVIAGYQFQGPEWESPPLIARLDSASGDFRELLLPAELQPRLQNYTASVAVSANVPQVAVTAPRGNLVLLLDYRNGQLLRDIEVADAAGVMTDEHGGFLVSSGPGGLYRVHADDESPHLISDLAVKWDNHLTPGIVSV